MKHELRNLVDRKVLIERMRMENRERTTISFYQYARIENPHFFRDYLFLHWDSMDILGRTYVAKEGINAQISVPTEQLDAFCTHLYSISFLEGIRLNYTVDEGKSFFKLMVKVKPKIVADGLEDDTFDASNCGEHLNAAEFNRLILEQDTILIDMRNHYESEVGHFKGAILPDVDTFREEINQVEQMLQGHEQRNIALYCTGGIRCEKASAYLKHKGFSKVHQLNGGIIEYTRQVREQGLDNLYVGKNFVFDERMAERISEDVVASCHQCGTPCDDHTNCVNLGCNLLFIQCSTCAESYEGACSKECQEVIHLSEEEQSKLRKGQVAKARYSKGRLRPKRPALSAEDLRSKQG